MKSDEASGVECQMQFNDIDETLDDIAYAMAGPEGKVWEYLDSAKWWCHKVSIKFNNGGKEEIDPAEIF